MEHAHLHRDSDTAATTEYEAHARSSSSTALVPHQHQHPLTVLPPAAVVAAPPQPSLWDLVHQPTTSYFERPGISSADAVALELASIKRDEFRYQAIALLLQKEPPQQQAQAHQGPLVTPAQALSQAQHDVAASAAIADWSQPMLEDVHVHVHAARGTPARTHAPATSPTLLTPLMRPVTPTRRTDAQDTDDFFGSLSAFADGVQQLPAAVEYARADRVDAIAETTTKISQYLQTTDQKMRVLAKWMYGVHETAVHRVLAIEQTLQQQQQQQHPDYVAQLDGLYESHALAAAAAAASGAAVPGAPAPPARMETADAADADDVVVVGAASASGQRARDAGPVAKKQKRAGRAERALGITRRARPKPKSKATATATASTKRTASRKEQAVAARRRSAALGSKADQNFIDRYDRGEAVFGSDEGTDQSSSSSSEDEDEDEEEEDEDEDEVVAGPHGASSSSSSSSSSSGAEHVSVCVPEQGDTKTQPKDAFSASGVDETGFAAVVGFCDHGVSLLATLACTVPQQGEAMV